VHALRYSRLPRGVANACPASPTYISTYIFSFPLFFFFSFFPFLLHANPCVTTFWHGRFVRFCFGPAWLRFYFSGFGIGCGACGSLVGRRSVSRESVLLIGRAGYLVSPRLFSDFVNLFVVPFCVFWIFGVVNRDWTGTVGFFGGPICRLISLRLLLLLLAAQSQTSIISFVRAFRAIREGSTPRTLRALLSASSSLRFLLCVLCQLMGSLGSRDVVNPLPPKPNHPTRSLVTSQNHLLHFLCKF